MLHRGIKFAHAVVLAFSATLSFLFLRSLDEDWALGHSAVVWVTDADGAASGSQVAGVVADFAAKNHATVAREVPDLKDPSHRRHLYLAPGGPHSDWLREGYPAFSRGYQTEVHPVSELGQRDPRGFYYVFGPDAAAASLTRTLNDLGLVASVNQPFSLAQLTTVYADSALYRSFFVVALAVVTMTGASVLLNAKAYGVQRLQGRSFGQILLRDMRQLAVFWSVACAAVSALTLLLLGLYNGLAWIGQFAAIALGVTTALSLVALFTHSAMLWLTFQTDVLRALKGELPARAASISAYVVRIPALLLALSIATAVVLGAQDVLARQESREAYAKIGDATSIRFNGSLATDTALRSLNENVGPWLRQADRDGQIIVAGHRDLRLSGIPGLTKGDLLVVNESFLAKQPLLDPAGRRIAPTAAASDQIRLLVPERLAQHTAQLTERTPTWLSPSDPGKIAPAQVKATPAKDGQRVFTYNPRGKSRASDNPGADDSLVTDPVIIVFPNGAPYLSDKGYTGYASQRSIVFTNPDDVTAGVQQRHLESYVTAVTPVGQDAALELRKVVGDFRLQLFNLVVAVAVLLITGVGVCIVHSRKNAQAIFARHISGWTFTATHRPVLLLEGLLALLLAGWVPFQVWQQSQDALRYESRGIPAPTPPAEFTGLDFGVTGVLVAVEVAAVLVALVVFHRRIVKEGATES
ncbi:bacteriocin-associated integral membrane family protein [Streptomyces sp. NPDC057705]|uniref:bacteriocin-associated integral membrane family protein n=1 Tax=Streptomyces sp. NPDC057705 TaxID=3346222 RepID=UPI0036A2B7B7